MAESMVKKQQNTSSYFEFQYSDAYEEPDPNYNSNDVTLPDIKTKRIPQHQPDPLEQTQTYRM